MDAVGRGLLRGAGWTHGVPGPDATLVFVNKAESSRARGRVARGGFRATAAAKPSQRRPSGLKAKTATIQPFRKVLLARHRTFRCNGDLLRLNTNSRQFRGADTLKFG